MKIKGIFGMRIYSPHIKIACDARRQHILKIKLWVGYSNLLKVELTVKQDLFIKISKKWLTEDKVYLIFAIIELSEIIKLWVENVHL